MVNLLRAGIAAAEATGQPKCIVLVDGSGGSWGKIRMTGARILRRLSAHAKARTASSFGASSDTTPDPVRPQIAAATRSAVTGLAGSLPIRMNGTLVGGNGVGFGSPDQDFAKAGMSRSSVHRSRGNSAFAHVQGNRGPVTSIVVSRTTGPFEDR